jgi:hypothetical protein
MAATVINPQSPLGPYPTVPLAAGSADLVWTEADNANGNETTISEGKTLLFAHNPTAGPLTITIGSVPDNLGRTGDISDYAVPAGGTSMFGPFKVDGWGRKKTAAATTVSGARGTATRTPGAAVQPTGDLSIMGAEGLMLAILKLP